jgi:hypothetical protein
VAFNRLKARGVRYGYIYADFGKEHRVQAGIIPVSDGVGDTLFSAAWDFNVGGISLEGKFNKTGYRLGYIRLVDTLSSGVDRDGEFIILDLNHSIFGAHVYYFNRKQISDFPGFLGDKISEGWYALTSSFNFDKFVFDAFAMMNSGKYSGVSHTGYSLKGEGKLSFNNIGFSLMAVYTTGSEDSLGKRSFVTPMGMLNSGGYWAYTHIFTPRESSDVNDFMLDIGNKGAGLFTSQAQFKISEIFEIMDFNLFGGIFSADRERNDSKSMGIELGGEFSFLFSQFLVLDVGASYAHLGDFFGQDIQKDIYEIFARLQLAF